MEYNRLMLISRSFSGEAVWGAAPQTKVPRVVDTTTVNMDTSR